jgi:hypothetical protein
MKLEEFIKINRMDLNQWLKGHLERAMDLTISLDDKDISGRTQAIIEARTYKKLLNEIAAVCGEKKEEPTNYI